MNDAQNRAIIELLLASADLLALAKAIPGEQSLAIPSYAHARMDAALAKMNASLMPLRIKPVDTEKRGLHDLVLDGDQAIWWIDDKQYCTTGTGVGIYICDGKGKRVMIAPPLPRSENMNISGGVCKSTVRKRLRKWFGIRTEPKWNLTTESRGGSHE